VGENSSLTNELEVKYETLIQEKKGMGPISE